MSEAPDVRTAVIIRIEGSGRSHWAECEIPMAQLRDLPYEEIARRYLEPAFRAVRNRWREATEDVQPQ